ncbi:MAG: DUF3800 domain-containing protein, partial [bacterium]
EKIRKLHEVISNSLYDFNRNIVKRIQAVTSKEIEQVQLADLLIGAVVYENRSEKKSPGKISVVERIKELSRYSLTRTTLIRESKFNLLIWEPRGRNNK